MINSESVVWQLQCNNAVTSNTVTLWPGTLPAAAPAFGSVTAVSLGPTLSKSKLESESQSLRLPATHVDLRLRNDLNVQSKSRSQVGGAAARTPSPAREIAKKNTASDPVNPPQPLFSSRGKHPLKSPNLQGLGLGSDTALKFFHKQPHAGLKCPLEIEFGILPSQNRASRSRPESWLCKRGPTKRHKAL